MANSPRKTVLATWMMMLALQTIGSIDMKHKLPPPKQYAAIGVLWSILFLAVDTGYARTAARFSVLVLLTATVLGPFGKKLVSFLETVSQRFAIAPEQGQTIPGAQPAPYSSSVGPTIERA